MRTYTLIFLFWFVHINIYAQISHSITFDSSKLKMQSRVLDDNKAYMVLEYEDCMINESVGQPSLPYKYLYFIVPNEPECFSITLNDSISEIVGLSTPLLPVQPPIATSINSSIDKIISKNISLAYSKGIYPEEIVKIVDDGYFDGDKRILTVRVSPVSYNAINKEIKFYTLIDFTIRYEYKLTKTNSVKTSPVHSAKALVGVDLHNRLKFVENKSDINKFTQNIKVSTVGVSLPTYEYVIVTSENLAPYFERLIDWKRQKGLNAGIITMQDILNNPSIVKDEMSNLSDDAGKLRQYLRLAYQNGTKYVLLGGGKSVVPIRYGYGNYGGTVDQIPSDWYYSDLNSNWDKDNDGYLGEAGEIDYYPEVYVGRILCKNKQEVENYIDKLLLYEQNPGKGDFAYLKKAFYSQTDQLQQNRQANTIANDLQSIFPKYTILEEYPSYNDPNPTFPTGKDLIDAMNQEYHGFLSWFAHGAPCGIGASTCEVNKGCYKSMTALDRDDCGIIPEDGNGLDKMTNLNYPAIAYSLACDVATYDTLITSWNTYDVEYNAAESLTVEGKQGCAAFLGNTRSGWVSSSFYLQRKFVEEIKTNSGKIGVAEALSKAKYKSHWLTLTHNLMGCPEFEMWTDIPSKFVNASISKSGNNLTVSSMTDDTYIALKGLFSNDNVTLKTGRTCTFTDIPNNYLVTLYKHDYLPYVYPIYLQNESVAGTHYLRGTKIYLGNHVDNTKDTGNFVIKSGANIVLDVSDEITLDAGTEIELGATFVINLK